MSGILTAKSQHHRSDASSLPVRKDEVLRYLGYNKIKPSEEVAKILDECIKAVVEASAPQSLYSCFDVSVADEETLDLGFAKVTSKDLMRNMKGCTHCILFAATIGPRVDQLIIKESRVDPLKGYILQSAGAMFIESYCDHLNEQLAEEALLQGYRLKPRFSPGYGDFSLEHQRDIFRHFQAPKTIGLTLMDSNIMAPSKSVTAVIGMYKSEKELPGYLPGCSLCGVCAKSGE